MENNSPSLKFMTSLTEFMQSLCDTPLDFGHDFLVTGQLFLSYGIGEKTEFVINEQFCKDGGNKECVFFSNSFIPSEIATIDKKIELQQPDLHAELPNESPSTGQEDLTTTVIPAFNVEDFENLENINSSQPENAATLKSEGNTYS